VIPPWALKALAKGVFVGLLLAAAWIARMEHAKANAAEARIEQLNADIVRRTKQAEVTQSVLSDRVQSQARIVTITKEILREVPIRIPSDACSLDPGWRVLHDAAAAGKPADPASGPDGAPAEPEGSAGDRAGIPAQGG
jgi:hypothetical protein